MKVKSSRGIVVKLICCMALVVIASAVAFSQTPKSGALLTITSNDATPVILKIYDSQIHTGTVRTPAGNGSCSALAGSDDIPTDAYVLQGGSPTGCDANDPFETASTQIGSATLSGGGYSFSVTAAYCNTAPSGTEISCTTVGPGNGCNSAGTICANIRADFGKGTSLLVPIELLLSSSRAGGSLRGKPCSRSGEAAKQIPRN